jgi:hypothetical protein
MTLTKPLNETCIDAKPDDEQNAGYPYATPE